MLTENDVIELTCKKLIDMGYEITQRLLTTEHGIDVIAQKGNKRLLIEAKGATSASVGTNRFGLEFSKNQVNHHVAMAFYATAKLITKETGSSKVFCIALPYNENHIDAVKAIHTAIERLEIKIIWVKEDGKVTIPNGL